ncbi:hypothetical protein KI387_001754, partial [Taxus chinensis]
SGRFSEIYGSYFCKRRGSSSVDRPACYQVTIKRRRLEKSVEGLEENVDSRGNIAGNEPVEGKEHCVEGKKEGNGGKLDLSYGHVDGFEEQEKEEEGRDGGDGGSEVNCSGRGRTGAEEDLPSAHMDRLEEKAEEEEKEDISVAQKGRRRGRGRRTVGAKEKKKNDVAPVLPVVGRITRSRAKQCQIVVSPEKQIGKRNAFASEEQLQVTRNTRARHNLQAEIEVPEEEPMNVTVRASVRVSPLPHPEMVVSSQNKGKSNSSRLPSPVMAVLSQTGGRDNSSPLPSPVMAVLLQTGGRDNSSSLPSPVMTVPSQTGGCGNSSLVMELKGKSLSPVKMEKFDIENEGAGIQTRNNSSPPSMIVTSQVANQPSNLMTQVLIEVKPSSPVMTLLQNEDNTAAPVMTLLKLDAVKDNAGVGKEVATTKVKLSSLELVCEGSNDMDFKRDQQEEIPKTVQECAGGWRTPSPDHRKSADSSHLKEDQQPEALDVRETVQLQETSNAVENGQISHMTISEMQILIQLQDNLKPVESKTSTNTILVDSSSLSNTCTLPEMVTSQCGITFATNKLGSRSVGFDRCKSVLVKEAMSDSKLLASKKQAHNVVAGREVCSLNKQMPFSRFARLCKPSDTLHSQGNKDEIHFSSREGSHGPKIVRKEFTGNENAKTPISHGVFQQTSICSSSSFDKDVGKQSAKLELETNPSTTALHVSCESFPGVIEDPSVYSIKIDAIEGPSIPSVKTGVIEGPSIPSVKNSVIEGSSDNEIEPAQSDKVPEENTLNCCMRECPESSLIVKRERPASFMGISIRVPSADEEDMTSQMEEVTEFLAEKLDKPSLYPRKSDVFQWQVGSCDSTLRNFCQDKAANGQSETMYDAATNTAVGLMNGLPSIRSELFYRNMVPVKEEEGLKLLSKSWPEYQKQRAHVQEEFGSAGHPRLLRSNSTLRNFCQDKAAKGQSETTDDAITNAPVGLLNGTPSIGSKLSYRNMVPVKEEEGPKLPNKSWPDYHIQRSHVQEEFCSAGHPRLLRSDSRSKAFEHDMSVLDTIPNRAKLISQYDRLDNEDQSRAGMMKIPSPKYFSYPKEGSSETFPDQEYASFLSSQLRWDEKLSPKDIEYRQMARLLLEEQFKSEELSTKMGLYPRLSCLTDLAEEKCQARNEFCSRSLPSCMSYSKNKEGSLSCTGLTRVGVDGMRSHLHDKAHLHATPSKSHSFRSSFEVTSPEDCGPRRDPKFPSSDDIISEFSFQKVLGGMDKCEMKSTPSMKRNEVTDWGRCGLSKSLAVNKKPSNQFKSAGQESHKVLTDGNILELASRKKSPSMEVDCQREVNIANNGLVKGVEEIPGMQDLAQSCYRFSSTRNTVDLTGCDNPFQSTRLGSLHDVEVFQEFERLGHGFSYEDRNFSLGKTNAKTGKGAECEAIGGGKDPLVKRDATVELYNTLGSLTPAPNCMSKYRIYTPSDVRWPLLSMDSKDYSDSSIENWGSYASEINNSGSMTPADGMFFARTKTNSMNTDSNLFSNQVQMNIKHAGCFPIEEESVVEEDNIDHHTVMNKQGKSFGSSTKKSILSSKNVLTDSSLAKQNSPLTTPAGRIRENSLGRGPNSLSKQALVSHKYFNSLNLQEEFCGKENINELQKRHGSSVKKKVLRTPNLRSGSSFASRNSPRSSQKPSNILCNMRSFIPLVQQKQAAAIMTGKREIKVKALEAAEAAKRLEEKREQDRRMRKDLVRRGEHEKSKEERCKGEKEGEDTSMTCSDSNRSISSGMARKKIVGCTLQKYQVESSSQVGTSAIGVDFKLKRALEAKSKLEQEKLKKLEEEKRRKEEERKKNAAEIAANKRKREEAERKDREEKRKRFEVAQRQQKELDEQLRAEKEAKEQRRRALDEYERKRKAMEEEAKKQRRMEKEKDAAERRRRIEEDAKPNKFASRDAKHVEEIYPAQKTYVGKESSMSNNSRRHEMDGKSMLGSNANSLQSSKSDINFESYEISPYKGSDEEDDDESAPGKAIPLWARKENLIPHIISQQYIDPDEIFTGAKTCSLNEVFESNGSNRRRDFNRRSHSGEWLNDSFTWREEYLYKLQMGYINKS